MPRLRWLRALTAAVLNVSFSMLNPIRKQEVQHYFINTTQEQQCDVLTETDVVKTDIWPFSSGPSELEKRVVALEAMYLRIFKEIEMLKKGNISNANNGASTQPSNSYPNPTQDGPIYF